MLWDIQRLMKPALSIIDMIPDVHRTPALAALRRSVLEGRPLSLSLSEDDRELAFRDAAVPMTSPIGARVLLALYRGGHLKLKKPPRKALPKLEAYAATEPAFRAAVARITAEEDARRDLLTRIIADPASARAADLTPWLVDQVMTAHLGYGALGTMEIGGIACHRTLTGSADDDGARTGPRAVCWWLDADGQRQGDAE